MCYEMENIKNILIVDDDLGMSESLFDILSETGLNVAVADDGYTAIDMISINNYDMVLMDIKMPGINGVEVLKKIKDLKPSLKALMMTAYTKDDLVKESFKYGAHGVIYKPLNIDKLLYYIKTLKKKNILLIVDDDSLWSETMGDILENENYNVVIKNSGEQAINYIKMSYVDIAIIDYKLPVMNGLEVFLKIKEINPKINGIMITAYRNEVENLVKFAFENGIHDCLYKPFEKEKILTLIAQIIRKELGFNENQILE